MKKINTLFYLLFFSACYFTLQAQSTSIKHTDLNVQVTYAQRIGTTLPVRDLVPLLPTDPAKRKQIKMNKAAPVNFAGRNRPYTPVANALPMGADPVRQSSMRSNAIDVEPVVNFDGITTGANPLDPTGDAGRDYYMQAVNATALAVYDKDGNLIGQFNANTIWSSIGLSSGGDPIVLFDQEAQRWLITEFVPPFGLNLLVAISETSDPLGSYTAYNFGTPSFPDYPKYGIWSNAYSLTSNEGGNSTLPSYFINREDLLAGAPTVQVQRIEIPGVDTGPGFQVGTPVDWSGLNPPLEDKPMVVSLNDDAWGGAPQDQIDLHTFDINWEDPAATTFTTTSIITAPYDTNPCTFSGGIFNCMPQLNGSGIDGAREIIMNQVHYRNFGTHESIVLNFISDASGNEENISGIRWMEVRRTPGGDWDIHQEGTFAPDDGQQRYMGSICMDGNGNIGLAYSASSEDSYVSLRFTGRRASDPLGEMTINEYVIVEGASTIPGSRYSDYAHMSIDPANDRTFWFTGAYPASNGRTTRIVGFELSRDSIDIGPITLNSPVSDSELSDIETVQIAVQNFGLDTQNVFQVGYIFENGNAVIEDVDFELSTDSIYTHTFSETIDMSVIGDYSFQVFTILEGDQAILNDTLRSIRSNLPRFDAGVTNILGIDEQLCGTSAEIGVELANFGTNTLTSLDLLVTLNGNLTTVQWTGSILSGETETIAVSLDGLISGTNEITVATAQPNGEGDEVTGNDAISRTFEAITGGVPIFLQLALDFYASETTWTVSDENDNIIYQGGPYDNGTFGNTLVIEEFCLDAESCFTFSIFDAFGDGICCVFGEGNYTILDADGLPLLTGNGDFGDEAINDFCATFECLLDASFDIVPESEAGANDGAIFIEALNGVGPFQYSIDGGENFSDENVFLNLPSGDYEIVILGAQECEYTGNTNIPSCALDLMTELTDATTPDDADGAIEVVITNGTPPYEYSIDGGENFQVSPLFENLEAGTYDIVVLDEIGCVRTTTVTLGVMVSTEARTAGHSIEVLPNPTDGIFRVNIKGLTQTDYQLPVDIFDANGKRIHISSLTKYNNLFTGTFSLYAYPDGVYFLRFRSHEIERMLRVIKQ